MIDYLIHFYRPGTEPFQSLSALPETSALRIMQDLYIEGSAMWERFKDPYDYLQARRRTEQWLRKEFIVKGGDPRDSCPIYMVLGRSRWLLDAADAATLAATAEIQIPLTIFGEDDVSFTCPDSMVSLMLAEQKDPEYFLPDYHGRLFTLSEIRAIVEANGLPGDGWGNLPEGLANYIEAQVWNREPLLAYERRP